jgi:Ni,Fe-hydrogenase I large subunit
LGNYMSAGAMNLTEGAYDRRSFLMPQGIVWDKDITKVDRLDAMKIGEEVAHSWYTYPGGETSLHPLQGQTNPAYEGFNPDGTLKTEGGYSWVKAPRYDGKPVEVGPLARMMVGYAAGDPKIRELMDGYVAKIAAPFSFFHSTVGRTVARALETQLVGESIPALLGGLVNNVKMGDDRFFSRYEAKDGQGFALGEAPRGMLSHWLVVENDQVKNYQAVVPTTWNASPKDSRGVRGAYEAALVGQPMHDPEVPLEVVRTIHSFDPCLACAVHVLNRNGEELSRFEVEV